MNTLLKAISCSLATVSLLLSRPAGATGLRALEIASQSARRFAGGGGVGTTLVVQARAVGLGPHHVCKLLYSANDWADYGEAKARVVRTEEDARMWEASVSMSTEASAVEYVFSCTDLSQPTETKTDAGLARSYGVTLRTAVARVLTSS